MTGWSTAEDCATGRTSIASSSIFAGSEVGGIGLTGEFRPSAMRSSAGGATGVEGFARDSFLEAFVGLEFADIPPGVEKKETLA
jgi:hypothetical protein